MTKQDLNSVQLTDDELENACGGAGAWTQTANGKGWMWKEHDASFSGNAANFTSHASGGASSTRREVIDGKSHYYKFDGTKEILVGIR